MTPEERASEVFKKLKWKQACIDAIRDAVAAEREACAQIADTDSILDWAGGSTGNAKGTAIRIASAIRARGEK